MIRTGGPHGRITFRELSTLLRQIKYRTAVPLLVRLSACVCGSEKLTPRFPAIQVDNEYSQSPASHAEYFAELEDAYHNSDIVVPLTYNDPGQGRNFINGTVGICCVLSQDPSVNLVSGRSGPLWVRKLPLLNVLAHNGR
jgi:hypothetical protein